MTSEHGKDGKERGQER